MAEVVKPHRPYARLYARRLEPLGDLRPVERGALRRVSEDEVVVLVVGAAARPRLEVACKAAGHRYRAARGELGLAIGRVRSARARQGTPPELLAELGCGTITFAILIGHTAGAQRFPTDAHFARMAGVAPIPAPMPGAHASDRSH